MNNPFLKGNTVLCGSEKDLSKKERYYRTLIHSLHEDLLVIDRDFRITDINNMALKTLGKTRQEVVGRFCYEVSHGLDEPCDKYGSPCPLHQVLDTGEPVNCHHEHVTSTGEIVLVDILASPIKDSEGNVTHVIEAIRDISDVFEAREALWKKGAFLNTLLDAIPTPAFYKDKGGRYLGCNKAFETFFGVTRERLIGNSVFDAHPPELAEIYHAEDTELFESGGIQQYESQVKNTHGVLCDVIFNKAVFTDSQGEISGLVGTVLDITKNKKLENQLHQAQKMEAVGQLAGGISHDFNNILGVIMGHTELAMDRLNPSHELFADLKEIRKAAERSIDLTRQLLAFARKQKISPRLLDLNETIGGMLKILRRLIGEDIDLVWMPGTGVWPVKIDPSQIDQILANLCVNARDAIPGVGKVTIETHTMTLDEVYCADHSGFVPGDYVLLMVSDNGCGMEHEILSKIFEPFFSTKEKGQGTGLGLATVYGIVKQNNGFINVYSEPGHGTTFKIYLPRQANETEQMKKEKPATLCALGHETILLVEDDPVLLKLTRTILEKLGYRVLAASMPGEAVRVAEEYAGEIHLLITDVVMPEMNGLDLAKTLISLYPDLKYLFMSGYTENIITNRGILNENENFIQKPFSMQTLAAKVREVLGSK